MLNITFLFYQPKYDDDDDENIFPSPPPSRLPSLEITKEDLTLYPQESAS
jgi:hypothetical protein